MTSLLATGAAGFIGSHFVRHWLGKHPDDTVVGLDALTYAGTETNLADVADRSVGRSRAGCRTSRRRPC